MLSTKLMNNARKTKAGHHLEHVGKNTQKREEARVAGEAPPTDEPANATTAGPARSSLAWHET